MSNSATISVHRAIVDALAKDGVICNAAIKEYDEKRTDKKGSGFRAAFKHYNDLIIKDHHILQVLTGDQRSNIYEAIPAIDFLSIENTSMMSTYARDLAGDVDPSHIITIPESDLSIEELIIQEDPYTLNRLFSNQETGLNYHLYNASGAIRKPDVVVDSYKGDQALIFRGVRNPQTVDPTTGKLVESFRKQPIQSKVVDVDAATIQIELAKEDSDDLQGVEKLSEESTSSGITFVSKVDSFNNVLKINLLKDDVILFIPAVSYSRDPSRLFIFKYSAGSYKAFAATLSVITPSILLDELVPGDALDNVFQTATLKETIDKFLLTEKEYYTQASCLLNGGFCEPLEIKTNAASNDVLKWKLTGQSEIAAQHGVNIKPSSRYFKGHLLGRGKFIKEPLKITPGDFVDGIPPKVPGTEEFYKGKATLLYDTLLAQANTLFDNVKTSDWDNNIATHPIRRLDSVTRKLDYSSSGLSEANRAALNITEGPATMLFPNKFDKQSNSKDISYKEIRDYLEYCAMSIEGDTLTLDTASENICCTVRKFQEDTAFSGHFEASGASDLPVSWSTGSHLYDKYNKAYNIEYVQHYKAEWDGSTKNFVLDELCTGLSVEMCSPIKAFAKKLDANSSQNTILVYPEYDNIFPEELYLISKDNLGLKEYGATNSEGGMVSFYRDVTSDQKLLSFKVAKSFEFKPSNITKVVLHDHRENQTFTREGISIADASEGDCYIYVLQPMELSLSKVTFYNQDDQKIALQGGSNKIELIPLSYPSDYFKTLSSPTSDDSHNYEVDLSSRSGDLKLLEQSMIIPDLPSFTDPEELISKPIGNTRATMKIFYDLITEGVSGVTSNLIKQGINTVLNQWKLTDSAENPIVLGDLKETRNNPGLVSGLILLQDSLANLPRNNFYIEKNIPEVVDGKVEIKKQRVLATPEDFNQLFQRITQGDKQPLYTFKVEALPEDKSSAEIDEIINLTLEGASRVNGQLTTLPDLVNKNLKKFMHTTRTQDNPLSRVEPLSKLKTILSTIYSADSAITRESCEVLDNWFGNNAAPLLIYGDPVENTAPYSHISLDDQLSNLLTHIIRLCDDSRKNVLDKEALDKFGDNLESILMTARYENNALLAAYHTGFETVKDKNGNIYRIYTKDDVKQAILIEGNKTLTGSVAIPANLEQGVAKIPVTCLQHECFKDGQLSELYIPATVKHVGLLAFENCKNLTKVRIAEGDSQVAGGAFAGSGVTTVEFITDKSVSDMQLFVAQHWGMWWADGVTQISITVSNEEASTAGSMFTIISTTEGLDSIVEQRDALQDDIYKMYYNAGYQDYDSEILNLLSADVLSFIEIVRKKNESSLGKKWINCPLQSFIAEYKIGKHLTGDEWWFTAQWHQTITNQVNDLIKIAITEASQGKIFPLNDLIQLYERNIPEEKLLTVNLIETYHDSVTSRNVPVPTPRLSTATIKSYLQQYKPGECEFFKGDLEGKHLDEDFVDFKINFNLPDYETDSTLKPSGEFSKIAPRDAQAPAFVKEWEVEKSLPDVSLDVLTSLAKHVANELEGSSEDEPKEITFLSDGNALTGQENSLYYQRYLAINNRLNFLSGTLSRVKTFQEGVKFNQDRARLARNTAQSFANSIITMPIAKSYDLSYMPTQEAVGSPAVLPGKFYYTQEMNALKEQIGQMCVLTCNKCSVRDSCPFYSEEEALKLYCTPAISIDLWVKDNELDLLYYDSNENSLSPNLTYTDDLGNSETLPLEMFQEVHQQFADVLKKTEQQSESTIEYASRDLENLRDELEKRNLDYDRTRDGLGWLLGARYGTVINNTSLKNLFEKNPKNAQLRIPRYLPLYNALHIADTESEIVYTPSTTKYKVSLDLGAPGNVKHYEGTTKIKIPRTLKLFANANPTDEVYLVSDDKVDGFGQAIVPAIYLGHVNQIKLAFDLADDGDQNPLNIPIDTPISHHSKASTQLYAKDVAQACVNYVKGAHLDDPVGQDADTDVSTANLNRDQYWMETMRKYIINENNETVWFDLPGRPRVSSGVTEPVADIESMDKGLILSGKPVIADYKNFVRRVSIQMYQPSGDQPGEGRWTIPWVNPRFVGNDTLTLAREAERKRAILPLMKTNLRLVVVKV